MQRKKKRRGLTPTRSRLAIRGGSLEGLREARCRKIHPAYHWEVHRSEEGEEDYKKLGGRIPEVLKKVRRQERASTLNYDGTNRKRTR